MAGLETYSSKRRFGVTAEPKGKVSRRRGRAFVIQKHAARGCITTCGSNSTAS